MCSLKMFTSAWYVIVQKLQLCVFHHLGDLFGQSNHALIKGSKWNASQLVTRNVCDLFISLPRQTSGEGTFSAEHLQSVFLVKSFFWTDSIDLYFLAYYPP